MRTVIPTLPGSTPIDGALYRAGHLRMRRFGQEHEDFVRPSVLYRAERSAMTGPRQSIGAVAREGVARTHHPATAVHQRWQLAQDRRIHQEIERLIAWSEQLRGAPIEVQVVDGMVTLRGSVSSPEQCTQLDAITDGVRGIRDVENLVRCTLSESEA